VSCGFAALIVFVIVKLIVGHFLKAPGEGFFLHPSIGGGWRGAPEECGQQFPRAREGSANVLLASCLEVVGKFFFIIFFVSHKTRYLSFLR